jgi:hydrogenase/urease accessory protein HupE
VPIVSQIDRARSSRVARACLGCVVVLGLALAASRASAHEVGLSRGAYRAVAEGLEVELSFARRDLAALARGLDGDGDGELSAAELAGGEEPLRRALVETTTVTTPAGACSGSLTAAELVAEDGVTVRLAHGCPGAAGPLVVTLAWIAELSFGHRHVAHLPGGVSAILSRTEASVTVERVPAGPPVAARSPWGLVWMGVEHILAGYDHLLFLVALLLVAVRARALVLAVTAFTLGHSITLALAALGIWAPSPRLVEPAIALSLAYVGVENQFVTSGDGRWRVTLPFGLLHGFGFAGALREVALPSAELPRALLAFNVGVELGQLAVLAVAVPLVAYARRRGWLARRPERVASGLVALAGLVWFVVRVAAPS